MKTLSDFAAFFSAMTLLALPALAEGEIDHRKSCQDWEYIPGDETIGNAPTVLLFCTGQDGRFWRPLQFSCRAPEIGIKLTYRPGYDVNTASQDEDVLAAVVDGLVPAQKEDIPDYWEHADADRLSIEVIPAETSFATVESVDPNDDNTDDWEDTPVTIPDPIGFEDPDAFDEGKSMISVMFWSFGFHYLANDVGGEKIWDATVKNIRSPVFTQLRLSSFADIYFEPSGITERFPLRRSDVSFRQMLKDCKALAPKE